MKLNELERNLKIKSDFVKNDEGTLKEKYFDSEEGYKKFLSCFIDEFRNIKLFPLMICDKYDFIERSIHDLISENKLKTPEEKYLSLTILSRIKNKKETLNDRTKEDSEQMLAISLENTGANKLKNKYKNYSKYIDDLYENIKKYNDLVNIDLPTCDELTSILEIGEVLLKTTNKEYTARYFTEIKKLYPQLELCYRPEIIVALNYALKRVDDLEEEKTLVNNEKRILELSMHNDELSVLYNTNFDRNEYKKVASVANKHLREYDKDEIQKNKVKKINI